MDKQETPNIDHKTGIRYGIICANHVMSEALNDCLCSNNATDLRYEYCRAEIISILLAFITDSLKSYVDDSYTTEELIEELTSELYAAVRDFTRSDIDDCRAIVKELLAADQSHLTAEVLFDEYFADDFNESYESDSTLINYSDDSVTFFYSSDSNCITVVKSDYFTYARLCSPCYPNAGDLDSPGAYKTYCLAPDFFDQYNQIPYAAYKQNEFITVEFISEDKKHVTLQRCSDQISETVVDQDDKITKEKYHADELGLLRWRDLDLAAEYFSFTPESIDRGQSIGEATLFDVTICFEVTTEESSAAGDNHAAGIDDHYRCGITHLIGLLTEEHNYVDADHAERWFTTKDLSYYDLSETDQIWRADRDQSAVQRYTVHVKNADNTELSTEDFNLFKSIVCDREVTADAEEDLLKLLVRKFAEKNKKHAEIIKSAVIATDFNQLCCSNHAYLFCEPLIQVFCAGDNDQEAVDNMIDSNKADFLIVDEADIQREHSKEEVQAGLCDEHSEDDECRHDLDVFRAGNASEAISNIDCSAFIELKF